MNRGTISTILFLSMSFPCLSSLHQLREYPHTLFDINTSLLKTSSKKLIPDYSESRVIEPPLSIGSFNVQTFVKKKFKNQDIMYVIEKVILRYDLILILEIHTDVDHFMNILLKDVNLSLPPEEAYEMILSERKNETREHYAFLYRKNKLRLLASESYDDPDIFYRKPLIGIFQAFTLRDMKIFGAVGQHVKPSQAVKEINGLADIYDYIKRKYETQDVLLMGDFNADCTYVKESDWDDIALWYRSEFTWAITSKMDTTTNYKKCALDRFVYAGENMNDGVILSSARVFDFQEEYMLSVDETRNVSDHWPIELKIRGKMSELAEKHLTSDICFHLRDSQQRKIIAENITILAENIFFNATKTASGVLLSNGTKSKEEMLDAVRRLRNHFPSLLSRELVEAIQYKVNYGTLKDDSSFADSNDCWYKINILSTNELVEVFICRTTSVN